MPILTDAPPLALYVHIPWCVQKCPYCDFNSHALKDRLPEELYVNALLQELEHHANTLKHRPLVSIFFGGGTPSLFSGAAIERILNGVATHLHLPTQTEITLEANPGTVDQAHFQDFRTAGINRLSIGIQSLQDDKLKTLGRIHDKEHALKAVNAAKKAGFSNFNLDIMHGLPNQSLSDAMQDLKDALQCEPTHFSWYQLTIEPNTLFYHQRPTLPPDETLWEIQLAGQDYLKQQGYLQYEVSAYAQANRQCAHNLNYWEFGDYLGIGAGAHSKLTDATGNITRFAQVRHPKDYLDAAKRNKFAIKTVDEKALIFEFMLNALRLTDGVPTVLFSQRTGVPLERISNILIVAQARGLLEKDPHHIRPTEFGRKFLNDLVEMFL